MSFSTYLPQILLALTALVVFVADLLLPGRERRLVGALAVVGLLGTFASVVALAGRQESAFGDIFLVDGYALFFTGLFTLTAVAVILASLDYVRLHLTSAGEYYGLIVLATLGASLMASSGELITTYISLELLSFSLYALAAYAKSEGRSNEAGVKYIVLGAFSSAIFLYGLSLLYGLFRTTNFHAIAVALTRQPPAEPAFLLALVLIIAGLGFKVAAVPFHMWTPDVYQGAPTPVTAFLAVTSKTAGFALLLRLFAGALAPSAAEWTPILAAMAAVTMTLGNLVALRQRNLKRLLAYSSIAQVGYVLVAMASLNAATASAVLVFLAGYAFTNLAAFIAIIAVYNKTGREDVPDYAGLADRAPFVALALTIALFSLAGMPLFAGFVTKFYLFATAATGGLLWLVGIAVLNSFVSLYYYLLIIKQMYLYEAGDPSRLRAPVAINGILVLLLAGVFVVGIYPAPLVDLANAAVRGLFG